MSSSVSRKRKGEEDARSPEESAPQPANAVWVCGPVQCVWDPTPDVGYVMPGYAAAWAAPVYPGCFWKRGLLGRWRMVCP